MFTAKKVKYCFYYKVDLYFSDLCFDGFNLYFSFLVSTVNLSRKIGATTAVWLYFSVKNANARIFWTVNCKKTFSTVSRTSKFGASRNSQTPYMTPMFYDKNYCRK